MRFLSIAILTLIGLVIPASAAAIQELTLDKAWLSFKQDHSKAYLSKHEEASRRAVFEANLNFIQKHNREASLGKHAYTVRINKFSDLTDAEYKAILTGFSNTAAHKFTLNKKLATDRVVANNIPDSVDWREKGIVNPIKDQGINCGSCWAFSAIASLESQYAKSTGQLVSFSEQQLVDCSRDYDENGCKGGSVDYAFQYIKDNRGIDTEDCYSYEAVDKACRFNSSCLGTSISGFVRIPQGDEQALTEAVASIGPISVCIDANHTGFQHYSDGIYGDDACSQINTDHCVAIVGYGSENGQDYFILRNSWGSDWGEQGYMRMVRGKNMCAIATDAVYPTI
jgi:cathepsin L